VAGAVAAVFGVSARANVTLQDALVEFLRTKQLLLVVDNCEHVLGAAGSLIDGLERACAGVVVLATSREGLGLDGERMLVVLSLGAPDPGADLDVIAAADAVQLFVERARAAKADFVLTATNAAAVTEVCRRLDGVPLAIELAAARVPAMSPGVLAGRLDQRFRVLTGGRRGAVERHQTLRAAIDWSFELCDPSERLLLARVTVFSGGCTLDAVEAVCTGDGLTNVEVFGVLAGLVARSLVVADDTESGELRYRLLETIRQYGEDRLAELDETETLRARHAEHFLAFARETVDEFEGPQQIAAGQRMTAERENILAAMRYAVDTDDVDLAFELLYTTPSPLNQLGFALQLPAADTLTLTGAADHPRYPFALALAGVQAASHGDRRSAETLSDDALAASQRLGDPDPRVEFIVSATGAMLARVVGASHEAALLAEHAVAVARPTGNKAWLATQLGAAASHHWMAGDGDAAIALATEGLALAREVGMPTVISLNLNALAGALAEQDPPRARRLLHESVEMQTRLGYEAWAVVGQSAIVAARLEDWPLTLRLAQSAIRHLHWMSDRPLLATMFNVVARALAPTDPDRAAMLLGAEQRLLPPEVQPNPTPVLITTTTSSPPSTNSGFYTHTRQTTTGLLAHTLGEQRLHELRAEGEALDDDSSVAYALHATERALASLAS
jgi:predicted ATPase